MKGEYILIVSRGDIFAEEKNKTALFTRFFEAQVMSGYSLVALAADKSPENVDYKKVRAVLPEEIELIHTNLTSPLSPASRIFSRIENTKYAKRIAKRSSLAQDYAAFRESKKNREKYIDLIERAESFFLANGPPRLIVVASSNIQVMAVAYILKKSTRATMIVVGRTDFQRRGMSAQNCLAKRILQQSDALAGLSPQSAQSLINFAGGKPRNLKIIPNPIDESYFNRPSSPNNWVSEFARGRYVYAGWTNWRSIKRIDIALRAFGEVTKQESNVCCILAGQVPVWAQDLISQLGITDKVLLAGPLPQNEIKVLSHGSDCCIIPSDVETFGNSAIEALAGGCYVVTTRCGGPESIISDKALGEIVECGDIDGFARAMLMALKMRDKELLREHCRQRYSVSAVAKLWKEAHDAQI